MIRFGRLAFVVVPSLTLPFTPSVSRAQRFVAFAGGVNASQGPVLPSQSLSAGIADRRHSGIAWRHGFGSGSMRWSVV